MVEDLFGLRPSEAETIAHLRQASLRHLDETGFRVAAALFWILVACTDRVAFFGAHKKRGRERGRVAIEAFGILKYAIGAICHDSLPTYFTFDDMLHLLCNAHHLRELTFVHDNLGERWAGAMRQLLITAKKLVDRRVEAGATLTAEEIERFIKRYLFIVNAGLALHPEPVREPGKRGRTKRAKGANLAIRLKEHAVETLAFLLGLPFTNNEAERDLRMIKIREKISGCLRTFFGAEVFARIRGYIVTARKNAISTLEAIKRAFDGDPLTLEQIIRAPA